jgi:hypothetical protein
MNKIITAEKRPFRKVTSVFTTQHSGVAVMFWASISEVPGSNIGPEVACNHF